MLDPAALQKLLAFASLVLLMVLFQLRVSCLHAGRQHDLILQATAVNGVLAIASTFVIITAGIDLSVGTLMTFCAVMAGVLLTYLGLPLPDRHRRRDRDGRDQRRGLGHADRQGEDPAVHRHARHDARAERPCAGRRLRQADLFQRHAEGFTSISQDSLIGNFLPSVPIPNAALIFLVLAALATLVLNNTSLGRYTFAIGSQRGGGAALRRQRRPLEDRRSTRSAVASAASPGLLLASRINSAQPALGQGYELDAIAAVVIGGTSLSGGAGTILGTIIGAFIMSVLTNGLRILSVAQEWQFVVTGIIIILAVYADMLRKRRA